MFNYLFITSTVIMKVSYICDIQYYIVYGNVYGKICCQTIYIQTIKYTLSTLTCKKWCNPQTEREISTTCLPTVCGITICQTHDHAPPHMCGRQDQQKPSRAPYIFLICYQVFLSTQYSSLDLIKTNCEINLVFLSIYHF